VLQQALGAGRWWAVWGPRHHGAPEVCLYMLGSLGGLSPLAITTPPHTCTPSPPVQPFWAFHAPSWRWHLPHCMTATGPPAHTSTRPTYCRRCIHPSSQPGGAAGRPPQGYTPPGSIAPLCSPTSRPSQPANTAAGSLRLRCLPPVGALLADWPGEPRLLPAGTSSTPHLGGGGTLAIPATHGCWLQPSKQCCRHPCTGS
jgi:hypothetical protein